jgi:hypothetical protein
MNTPQTIPITLAANARTIIPITGKYAHLHTLSVATCTIAFDEEAPQTAYAGIGYSAVRPFKQVSLADTLGGGLTAVLIVSDLPIVDGRAGGFAAAMAASLAAIDLDCDNLATIDADTSKIVPASAGTVTAAVVVAQTGVGETQLITAAATNKRILIQNDIDSAGSIYLRFVTGVTAANCGVRLLPGETWVEEWAGNVFACSENGTETARGYVIRTA